MSPALLAAKLALGPVLLPQARWLRRTALRLPEAPGPRAGVAGEGAPVLRVLVVGDSAAAGVGIADQAQALALPLAHELQVRLGGAVGWQLVAQTGVDTREAIATLLPQVSQPADVVVTSLGVNDVSAQSSAEAFVAAMAALWANLQRRTGARWLVCSGLPPMHLLSAVPHPLRWYLGRYADWLDAGLRDWCARERLGFCDLRWTSDASLLAPDGFHPGPLLHAEWARRLAELIVVNRQRWVRE